MKFILKLSLVFSFIFVSSICQAKSGIEASCSVDVWRWGEIPQYIQELDAFPDFIPLTGYVIRTELHYTRTWFLNEDYPGNVESSTVLHNEYADTYKFPYTYWLDHNTTTYTEWIYDDSYTPPRTIAQIDHYDGYYIGCGTLNTVDKHVFRKRFYIANASTPPHDTNDPEEMFNLYDGFDEDVILIEGLPSFPSDECGISFVDTQDSTWYKWLPTAPLEVSDKPDTLKLNFEINSDNKEACYRLRARLYNISWFPGRWTNDFLRGMNQHTPGILWPDSSGLIRQPCGEEKWADIVLEPSKNPGWSLYFNDVDEGMSSWYELSYNDSVRNGDKVSLTITSRDFGAHSRLCAGLTNWNDDKYYDFEAMPIYNRTIDDSISCFLPIPRDEEVFTYTYPDTIKEHAGEKVIHSTGDWLADAWEEKYVNFSSNMTPDIHFGGASNGKLDSTIYRNIYACGTYSDDSHIIKICYPSGTSLPIRYTCDGFTNLEKYRGFYGITDQSGISLEYSRLSPHIRNIFVVPFEEIPIDSTCADSRIYKTTFIDTLGYPTVSGSLEPWIRVYTLLQNPEDDENIITNNTHYYRINKNMLNTTDYDFRAHSLILNNLLFGIANQSPVVAIWANQVYDSSTELRQYINDFIDTTYSIDWITEKPDTMDWVNDHPLGITIDPVLGTDSLQHELIPDLPRNVTACYTFTKYIEKTIQSYIDSSRTDFNTTNRKLRVEQFQSTVFGHELGHFLGIRHYNGILYVDPISNDTIFVKIPCMMNTSPDSVNHLQQTRFIKENYRYFKPGK